MKMTITIDVDADDTTIQQIKRSGLSVVKHGTYYRVKVSDHHLAREQAVVQFSGLNQEANRGNCDAK